MNFVSQMSTYPKLGLGKVAELIKYPTTQGSWLLSVNQKISIANKIRFVFELVPLIEKTQTTTKLSKASLIIVLANYTLAFFEIRYLQAKAGDK